VPQLTLRLRAGLVSSLPSFYFLFVFFTPCSFLFGAADRNELNRDAVTNVGRTEQFGQTDRLDNTARYPDCYSTLTRSFYTTIWSCVIASI